MPSFSLKLRSIHRFFRFLSWNPPRRFRFHHTSTKPPSPRPRQFHSKPIRCLFPTAVAQTPRVSLQTESSPSSRTITVVLAVFCAVLFSCLFTNPAWSQPASSPSNTHQTPWFSFLWNLRELWKSSDTNYQLLFSRYLQKNWKTKSSWFPAGRSRSTLSSCKGDPTDIQQQSVHSLLHRRFPSISPRVRLSRQITCPASTGSCFEVSVVEDSLCIRGSNGVDLAAGFHWFLKRECKGFSTWWKAGGVQFQQNCLSPRHLHELGENFLLFKSRVVPLSFYQNMVTASYSMAYWDWSRWEDELDWMALHGVNLPLALTGQEYIWTMVYQEVGIEFAELGDFFTGPSFLAWGRMGNIQGYAGPLPWAYIESQFQLQKKILDRMRSFGMTPVLSGFAGFIPRALLQKFPEASAKILSNWCEFPAEYCCVWILDPTDLLFQKIGGLFMKHQRELYGPDPVGFYSVDVFNEMTPSQSNPVYLRQTSDAVYSVLKQADSKAVWIMQGWLFHSNQEFWKAEQIKAVLSGVPAGRLLLLDLYAEKYPQWKKTESFFGHPYIWSNLHNFGGNTEMHGAIPQIAQGVLDAQSMKSPVVGVGMCPEGLEQNPVVYELTSEMSYRDKVPELRGWFEDYTAQRYGGKQCKLAVRAWKMLSESVYENTGHRPDTVMDIPNSRPGLDPTEDVWGLKPHIWYNPNKVIEAWRCLLECQETLGQLSSYRYDLVDVSRQVLSKLATKYWKRIGQNYRQKKLVALQEEGERLLELLSDLDQLLATHEGFLLGSVLQEAWNYGQTEEEKILMVRNVKLQLTVWGESPNGDTELSDYANKQWAGLMGSFYRERWRLWIERLKQDLKLNRDYNSKEFIKEMLQFTHDWINSENMDLFHTTPQGKAQVVSQKLYNKYKDEAWILDMAI